MGCCLPRLVPHIPHNKSLSGSCSQNTAQPQPLSCGHPEVIRKCEDFEVSEFEQRLCLFFISCKYLLATDRCKYWAITLKHIWYLDLFRLFHIYCYWMLSRVEASSARQSCGAVPMLHAAVFIFKISPVWARGELLFVAIFHSMGTFTAYMTAHSQLQSTYFADTDRI